MSDTDQPETEPTEPEEPEPRSRARKWIIGGLIAVVALVVLFYGAVWFYANVLNDSPDALDEADLTEAVAETDPPAGSSADEEAASTTDSSAPDETATSQPAETDAPAAEPEAASLDGTWVPTDASEFGYRVEEVIAGVNVTAVGRSNEIDGTLVIADTTAEVDVAVLVENIESDDARRDSAFRGRIMEADDFPEATFATTEPIEFGEIPPEGEQVTATATGELTLKDVSNPVTFEVTAERSGDRIGVLGSIPVVFADYGIDNPSFGAIKTEDEGLVEFVLVFTPE